MVIRSICLAATLIAAAPLAAAQGLGDLGPKPATDPAPPPPPPPPPPPGDERPEWYVADGQASRGPFTLTQLRQAAQAGQIQPATQVYRAPEGWRAAKDVPELQGYLPSAGPTPPPPPPPVDAQKSLDQRAQNFIVGTWRYEGTVTQGGYTMYVIAELTYRADMSVAGFQSIQVPGYGGYQPPPTITELRGRYTVTGIDEQNFTLTNTFQGTSGQTTKLKIIDANTVENQADGARSYRVR